MKNKNYFILLVLFLSALQIKAQYSFDNVLYGAAYYHEYMPYERLDEDIRLMKRAGLTVVRVGESAWGVFEPQEGNFEFEWMDRILDKMHAAGIKVILGTPTYSIPAWLAYKHPEVLAEQSLLWNQTEHGFYKPDLPILLRTDYPQDAGKICTASGSHRVSSGQRNRSARSKQQRLFLRIQELHQTEIQQ